MTIRYRLSHFTAALPGFDGELLLVNSFMGALARISAEYADTVRACIEDGVAEAELPGELAFLLKNGYFVDDSVDEQALVSRVLEQERTNTGQELIILPHENCNFRCVYCYETFSRGKMTPEIVEASKSLVEKRAKEWGRVHISWFGGEPLLAKDVVCDLSDSFIRSCRDAAAHYSAAMTTNGFFLTENTAVEMIEREVRFFQITVDGPAAAHNERRHLAGGGPTYKRVLDNLVGLHDTDLDFTVRLRINYDPNSIDSLAPWITEELAPQFAGDDRFHLAFHPIGRWGGPNDADLAICSEDSGWQTRNQLYRSSTEAGFSPGSFRSFLSSHGSTCYAGRESSIVIGSDGRLYKCTVAFDDPRNHVGWLRPDGVLDIDQQIFNRWVNTDDLDTGKCQSCWFHGSCQSRSCPLVAMDNGTPPCPTQKREMVQIVQITAYGQHAHRFERL